MKFSFLKNIIFTSAAVLALFSCNKEKPALVYFPDMYYPVAYEPLQEDVLAYSDSDYKNSVPLFQKDQGRTALDVVPHTIYRNEDGLVPMEWEINFDPSTYNANYNKSLEVTVSPLDSLNKKEILAEGKVLYEKTCLVCHGPAGDGNGPIVESGAYSGVPSYRDRAITVGSVYYVIRNGRNNMGSYAGQLQMQDRWKVAEYVINEFKQ